MSVMIVYRRWPVASPCLQALAVPASVPASVLPLRLPAATAPCSPCSLSPLRVQAVAVEHELEARTRSPGSIWSSIPCFVVPDPSNARVGSGGATFNALITVQDLMSRRSDIDFATSRVFVIHSGGDSQRLPLQSVCGKAWCSFPVINETSHNIEVSMRRVCVCGVFFVQRTSTCVCLFPGHRHPLICCWPHYCACSVRWMLASS